MQKITPHIWYDKDAKAAAQLYTSIFPDSKITNINTIHDTPSGDCDIVSFDIMGYSMMSISAGPFFKPTPSISFMVNFDPSQDPEAVKRIDGIWEKLLDGGTVLMPLSSYPFSKRYGWVSDKYGVSWQLILTDPNGDPRPKILPSLLFVGNNAGKTQEATDFYLSVFHNTKRGMTSRYPAGMEPDKEGTIQFTDFMLEGQWLAAMDSAHDHKFTFTEAISFIVHCESQEEIDMYWSKLSAVPESEQCGWLKDKYGVSWQIVPNIMNELMQKGTKEQSERVTKAFLSMKKFDIATLQSAYDGT